MGIIPWFCCGNCQPITLMVMTVWQLNFPEHDQGNILLLITQLTDIFIVYRFCYYSFNNMSTITNVPTNWGRPIYQQQQPQGASDNNCWQWQRCTWDGTKSKTGPRDVSWAYGMFFFSFCFLILILYFRYHEADTTTTDNDGGVREMAQRVKQAMMDLWYVFFFLVLFC